MKQSKFLEIYAPKKPLQLFYYTFLLSLYSFALVLSDEGFLPFLTMKLFLAMRFLFLQGMYVYRRARCRKWRVHGGWRTNKNDRETQKQRPSQIINFHHRLTGVGIWAVVVCVGYLKIQFKNSLLSWLDLYAIRISCSITASEIKGVTVSVGKAIPTKCNVPTMLFLLN